MSYHQKLFFLIAISTAARLITASSLELSNAEVYYWAYSLHLEWNYFDHPPMVAWLIRLTTFNHLFDGELFVRFGAIIASALCTFLMFKIGALIYDLRTGWFAALLFTSSLYCSIAAGTFILPDSPQTVFWLLSLLLLLKISRLNKIGEKTNMLWCLFGFTSGLCIMSKVHGIFLWVGVVLYVLFMDHSCLKKKGIYLAMLITLFITSPIIIWNLQNNFVTYTAYSSRIAVTRAKLHAGLFGKNLLAVIIVMNPVNFFLNFSSLDYVFCRKARVDKSITQLILLCSLPLIVTVLFISLFRETLAHWAGPGYTCLLLIPSVKLASATTGIRRDIPIIIKLALAFTLIIAFSEILFINKYPGTTSEQSDGLNLGKGDVTLDMYGWKEAGEKFDSLYKKDVGSGLMPSGTPIIINKWYPAAHIDYYIASKTKQQTFGIGDLLDLGQYYWMNQYKRGLQKGDSAYFILPSNFFDFKGFDAVTSSFISYDMPLVISEYRSSIVCRKIYVFRLKGYRY